MTKGTEVHLDKLKKLTFTIEREHRSNWPPGGSSVSA